MAEIRWIKVVVDLFEDEKMVLIETMEGADGLLVIWLKLLCLAGKQNNCGVFAMQNGQPYTESMLAAIFRREEAEVARALKIFEEFGMIERCGGAVVLKNWGKHQNFDKIEKSNDYMRRYMRQYREKQREIAKGEACKLNGKTNRKVNVNGPEENREEKRRTEERVYALSPVNEEAEAAEGADEAERFEQFWQAYPRKDGKVPAREAFDAAGIGEGEMAKLLGKLEQYKRSAQWTEAECYIPMASRFLKERRWEDEAPPAGKRGKSKHKLKNLQRDSEELAMLEEKWLNRGAADGGGKGAEGTEEEDFRAMLDRVRKQGVRDGARE